VFLFISFLFILFSVLSDPAFTTKQEHAIEEQHKTIKALEQEYQKAIQSRSAAELTKVLNQVKPFQTAIRAIRAELETAIETEHFEVSFLDRILFECFHIRSVIYEEVSRTIAQEILGQQAGVSDFPHYQFSNQLETAVELMSRKFLTLLNDIKTTDTLIVGVAQRNTTLSTQEKQTILKSLTEGEKVAASIHVELSKDYATVVENLHRQGQQVRLVQRMELEAIVDQISFVQTFLVNFHELFLAIE